MMQGTRWPIWFGESKKLFLIYTMAEWTVKNRPPCCIARIAPCNTGITNKSGDICISEKFEEKTSEKNVQLKNVVSIYPNQANNKLNLYLNFNDNKINSIQLFDILGNKKIEVFYDNLPLNTWLNLEINISGLPKAMYICLITYVNGYEKVKFVKI